MKHLIRLLLAFSFLSSTVCTTACSDEDPVNPGVEIPVQPDNEEENGNEENNEEQSMERNIKITVNGVSFNATLADNAAAQAFASMLPLTVDMDELNGNEKYCYLDTSLPTDSYSPGTIHTGDIMLYGSSCIVIFYETFSTGYRYTRLGQIDDSEGLAAAVGEGSVTVRFETSGD